MRFFWYLEVVGFRVRVRVRVRVWLNWCEGNGILFGFDVGFLGFGLRVQLCI